MPLYYYNIGWRKYMKNVSERLVNKSIEAFIMSLELHNKPTIKYRIEGFAFFICNAWELMLKAHLINRDGESSIYFSNDKERTISLTDAISRVYTDVKQPLRINIEEINKLRNTATHFITEDDEILYAPFFQSNILSFGEQIKRFHGIEITDYIPQNFLTLSIDINVLSDEEITAKYSLETAKKYLSRKEHLEEVKRTNSSNDLFIPLRIEFFSTKNKDKADITYAIDNNSDENVRVIKTEIDPKDKYSLTRKNVITGVNKQLNARNIKFNYVSGKGESMFNEHTLTEIMYFYKLHDNYVYTFGHSRGYSQQLVNEIVRIIQQNPDVITHIKNKKR